MISLVGLNRRSQLHPPSFTVARPCMTTGDTKLRLETLFMTGTTAKRQHHKALLRTSLFAALLLLVLVERNRVPWIDTTTRRTTVSTNFE